MRSLSTIDTRSVLRAGIGAFALAAATIVSVSEASAWDGRRHHWRPSGGAVAAGVIGGVALGALAAGAARPYYRPAPYYAAPAPVYYRPRCHWEGRRVWDGWGWRWGRVRVCERW